VDITELSEADLADDALMGQAYELSRRAETLGREAIPFWTLEEFLGAFRAPDPGERQQIFVGREDGELVALGILWSFLLDNTDKAFASIDVDVPARRRGHGRALVERLAEVARTDGRNLLLADTKLPYAEREGHGHQRFAEACGFELSNYEVVRHLSLPVPDERIQGWLDQAASRHEGYTLETYAHDVPDDVLPSLLGLMGQLAVDAPTGQVDFEEEVMTPERFAAMLHGVSAMGRARYETVALTPDRQVVAHSTLAVPLGDNTTVFQWGTFVHREHRGHALGLATKATNLRAVQAFRDDLTLVTTQNAETNDHMVDINTTMGFRPVEVSAEYLRRL
jgi:GNAT superfamily N-acetyltransferase